MANRYRLLERLAVALSHPGVDGVLGTPDIIDDLALLGLLDDKVVVGSMNRGGLRGAAFEMDDRFTGYDVSSMSESGIDFAKAAPPGEPGRHRDGVHTRSDRARGDRGCRRSTADHARAVHEPLGGPARRERPLDRCRGALAGDRRGTRSSSAYTWMKLPVVPDMERVMEATTLPTLLLGGDAGDDPDETFASWEDALALPGVRGLTVGRNLLYPPDGDVAAAVDTAARLVHTDL